jgi:hypothetical protein
VGRHLLKVLGASPEELAASVMEAEQKGKQ